MVQPGPGLACTAYENIKTLIKIREITFNPFDRLNVIIDSTSSSKSKENKWDPDEKRCFIFVEEQSTKVTNSCHHIWLKYDASALKISVTVNVTASTH